MVDVTQHLFEMGQVFPAFAHPEVLRVVDRTFGAQPASLFEILLEIKALVPEFRLKNAH
jgi:hypothetical protein